MAKKNVNYVTIASDKSKRGAFFRCLIGGIFGWHYFYVGRTGRGFLCWITFGNFFVIGNIIDLWKIHQGKFKDNVGQYLRQ